MKNIQRQFDDLKTLLDYPNAQNQERIQEACHRLKQEMPSATVLLNQFLMQSMSGPEMEEEYIRAFDFNPDCALEIGWHLYGENYGRGDFLVKMRDLLKHCGIEESTELPDHLTYVLLALGRLEPHQAQEFAKLYVLPGLKKLVASMEKRETPYRIPLLLIQQVLQENYGEATHEQPA